MKLSHKILLYLMIVFLFLIGTFSYFWYEIGKINQAGEQFTEEWRELEELQALQNSLSEIIQTLNRFENTENPESVQISSTDIQSLERHLERINRETGNRENGNRPHEKRERRLEADIVQTTEKIIDLVKPLSRNESITSWNTGIAIAGFTNLNQTINQYIEEDRREVRSALEELHQVRSRAPERMIVIGILMLISLSLYSWYVYRSMIGPVKSIRSSIRSVANEDFDQPVEYDRDDELGEIARDFNTMVEKLNEAWDTMEEKVEEKTKQLLLREKLSTVGEMASRMAHELNTPLATIGTAAEGIENRVDEDDEQVHEYAEIMKTESTHCKEILDRFLEMARSPSEEKRPVRLDELCRDTLSMLEFLPDFEEANIDVSVDLEPAVVEGNVSLLRQVMFNLLKNGMKSVLSEEARNQQPRLEIELIADNDTVRFVVEDNGKGFDPADKQDFFEPFVTTYTGDEGVGLGLSISRQIIDEHGGDLDLESDGPGEGCRAYFELPLEEEES